MTHAGTFCNVSFPWGAHMLDMWRCLDCVPGLDTIFLAFSSSLAMSLCHPLPSPRLLSAAEFGSAVSMSLEPRGSSLHRRLSRSPEASVKSMSVDLHSRRDSGAGSPSPMRQLSPNPQRSSAAAAAGVGISRHAAALADGMYAAAAQSLSLLCSLAPEVRAAQIALTNACKQIFRTARHLITPTCIKSDEM